VTIGRVICSSAEVVNGVSAARREGGGRRANWASIVGPLTAIQRSTLSFWTARAARTREPACSGRGHLTLAALVLGMRRGWRLNRTD
jgi:hypothetical protein